MVYMNERKSLDPAYVSCALMVILVVRYGKRVVG